MQADLMLPRATGDVDTVPRHRAINEAASHALEVRNEVGQAHGLVQKLELMRAGADLCGQSDV